MCIIIGKPLNVPLPSDEVLETCARKNRDGIGMAWTHNNHVRIKKDFLDVDALKAFLRDNIVPAQACIIHFRIATAGVVDEGNRHPFPLTRKRKRLRALESVTDMAVAHNGTLSDLTSHKKYSDTMLFVREVLSDPVIRNNIMAPPIQELISGYLGYSKLAILDRSGRILRFGTFETDSGLFYSNSGFKDSSGYGSNYAKVAWEKQCVGCFEYLEEKYLVDVKGCGLMCQICIADQTVRARLNGIKQIGFGLSAN